MSQVNSSFSEVPDAQETHGKLADIVHLQNELGDSSVGGTTFPDTVRAGGIFAYISHELARQLTQITHHAIQEGRILFSKLVGDRGDLAITNARMPNACEALRIDANSLDDILLSLPPAA
eukprot:1415566-Pyramimonas_sp.AAC.1